jgi:hypothetical protein
MLTLRFAEAAAASEQARQAAEKAEEEKDALRKEIVALHARLGSQRSRDGDGEEGGNSLTEEPAGRHVLGASAALSMGQENDASQHDRKSEMLSELLSDFNTQLANNYAQVRTALHHHQVPPACTHVNACTFRCNRRQCTFSFR